MRTLRSLDGSDDEAAWHPPACSARLAQAAQSAEYKQVTVLFADVVRSMDIAATVGSAMAARDHGSWSIARVRSCGATAGRWSSSPGTD